MAKVLVCGLCPLPFENTRKNYGPGIRTWQFAQSLARERHQVRVLAMRIADAYCGELPPAEEERDGIAIRRVSDQELLHGAAVAETIAGWNPELLVGATVYGSHAIARTAPVLPFWADQFGHVMAEAQAKASLESANWPLAYFWRLLQPVLASADRISAVSERHRCAVIGELGAVGRLTSEAAGYEFTAVIPCAAELEEASPATRPMVRGRLAPQDAFLVLWSGSFNVWSDVETLCAGVDDAMREEPRLHFVSTGGAIDGHDDRTYARFQELVTGSPFRGRYHLAGWVPHDEVAAYTAEADVGVLTERPLYEGMMGSKNRVIHWLAHGVPVVYNRVGDLGDLLATGELGRTFAPGDAHGLARQLVAAARDPQGQRAMAERARRYAREHLSFSATTRALAAWCATPTYAPDRPGRTIAGDPSHHATPAQRVATQFPLLRLAPAGRWLSRLAKRIRG